jgi:signal transduction histidine kinase
MERSLRDAERVRVAGLLGATVAHDMNNMMAVVQSGLDQLEEAVRDAPDALERLVTMRQALERSSELARRLTAFGRRGGGGVRRVDLGAVVEKMRTLLVPVVRRGHELTVQVAAGEHPVRVDESELEQAIVNLVVNARDALGPEGRVRIDVERRPGGQHPHVALVISDDGVGMDAETQAHIFEPFFTTKGPERGTGLGMVVVKSFVAEAGGEIRVDSAPGRGTRVELSLPVDVEPLPAEVLQA